MDKIKTRDEYLKYLELINDWENETRDGFMDKYFTFPKESLTTDYTHYIKDEGEKVNVFNFNLKRLHVNINWSLYNLFLGSDDLNDDSNYEWFLEKVSDHFKKEYGITLKDIDAA